MLNCGHTTLGPLGEVNQFAGNRATAGSRESQQHEWKAVSQELDLAQRDEKRLTTRFTPAARKIATHFTNVEAHNT